MIINPEVQLPKGSEIGEEGCLSLPGLVGKVARPHSVKISAFDIQGNQIETRIEGFLARIFLHEIDHLDGKMFFDRMDEAGVGEISEGIEDFIDDFRSQQESGTLPSDEELIARLQNWTDKYC